VGVFDSLQGAHCRFLPDRQGQLRCLPNAPPSLEALSEFVDAGCSQRVYRAYHLDNVAVAVGREVAVASELDHCEQRYLLGKLKETAVSRRRFAGNAANCFPVESTPADEMSHDFVLEETSPDAWLSAREVDGPLMGGRLRLRQFLATDGSLFGSRLVDEQWDKTCSLSEVDGKLLCVPPTLDTSSPYFEDAECKGKPLQRADACSQAVYIGSPSNLHALGKVWQGTVYASSKICEAMPEDIRAPGDRFFEQGEALGLDALAGATWSSEGAGRLQLRGLAADDGSLIPLFDDLFDTSSLRRYPFQGLGPRFRDTEAGGACGPVWTRDAGVRCVPDTALVDPYTYFMYADAACTEPVYLCGSASCADADLVLMTYDENGERRAISRNRAVDLTNQPYFSRDGDACVENAPGGPNLFKAGPALPWDDYPELEELNGRASGAP
jgi:hypothetical protein